MLRKVLGSGGDGGKRKTVRAEDGGEVRRRLREHEAGWEGANQKVGGTDARGANVEGVCERGAGGRGQQAKERPGEGYEWKRCETRVGNGGKLEVRE